MTQEFFGVMALSLSLLACCYGVYFTVWAGALVPKMPGVKAFGVVATALAVFSLVFASYCLAQTIFMQRQMQRMMVNYPAHKMDKKHMKQMKQMKQMKTNAKTTTNQNKPQ